MSTDYFLYCKKCNRSAMVISRGYPENYIFCSSKKLSLILLIHAIRPGKDKKCNGSFELLDEYEMEKIGDK